MILAVAGRMRCRLALLMTLATAAHAQSPADRDPPSVLTARDGYVAGAFALGTIAAAPLDRALAERLQRPGVQNNRTLRRTATLFRTAAEPGVAIALPSVWAIGRLAG